MLTLNETLRLWLPDFAAGTPPVLWRVGNIDWDAFELGPGLLTLIGGAPGAGKTALVMQAIIEALRADAALRVLVANVEMTPNVLLERQISRLAGIPASQIRFRTVPDVCATRLDDACQILADIGERLAFHTGPDFGLKSIAEAADGFEAGLIVLDYIQRIGAADGSSGTARERMTAVMQALRGFCGAGIGVLAVSALGRLKDDAGGNSYDSKLANLASFRESSELEYGADSAWILSNAREDGKCMLRCLKNRHGGTENIRLHFAKSIQTFTIDNSPVTPSKGKAVRPDVRAAWGEHEDSEDDTF